MMRTKIFDVRKGAKEEIWLWIAHGMTGVTTGFVAFLMALVEDKITRFKADTVQNLIQGPDDDEADEDASLSFVFYLFFGTSLILVANLLTIYVGPGANGSGVAEVMGLLNGINYPDVIGLKTLFVKIVGTTLAVSGGLCIGKEGPLLHIGAIIGCIMCFLPFEGIRCLQNDVSKRQMIAAGGAAGVAAAFGAPIGGALFTYEISKPNTFWTFSMLWRVFFGTALSVFTLSLFTSLDLHAPLGLSDTAILKFGTLETQASSFLDLPAAVAIGLFCGMLGTAFVWTSSNLGIYRKKYIDKNWKKIVEAIFFGMFTASMFYLGVYIRRDSCLPEASVEQGKDDHLVRFMCPDGEYNQLATLVFNTEGGIIRSLLRVPVTIQNDSASTSKVDAINIPSVLIFLCLWVFFTFTTYGVWVPAGLFLPGIIIGSTIGLLYMQFMLWCGMEIWQIGG
jgi:H+/Cl- antiporter ClcA